MTLYNDSDSILFCILKDPSRLSKILNDLAIHEDKAAVKAIANYALKHNIFPADMLEMPKSKLIEMLPEDVLSYAWENYDYENVGEFPDPKWYGYRQFIFNIVRAPATPVYIINELYSVYIEKFCGHKSYDEWRSAVSLPLLDDDDDIYTVVKYIIAHPNLPEEKYRALIAVSGNYVKLAYLAEQLYNARPNCYTTYGIFKVFFNLLTAAPRSPHFNEQDWLNLFDLVVKCPEKIKLVGYELPCALAKSHCATPDGLKYLWRFSRTREHILSNPRISKGMITDTVSKLSSGKYVKNSQLTQKFIEALGSNPSVTGIDLAPLLLIADSYIREAVQDVIAKKKQ